MSGNAGKTRILVDTTDVTAGDSIASYLTDAAGALLTSTLVGGTKQSLDVNVTQSALPTGAATEATLATLATEATLASVLSAIGALEKADGAAWSAGTMGIETLAVRQDASGPLTGVADGDWSPLQVDANGALKVAGSFSVTPADNHAEDSAASSGDQGSFSLSVRNDNQATTPASANGDYQQFSTDLKGALYVKDIHAAGNLQQVVTVGTSAVALPTSPLANRASMFIQMLSGGSLYLGSSTVTNSGSTRGFMLGNGGYVNVDVGPANLIYGVANAAGKEVLVWEFA